MLAAGGERLARGPERDDVVVGLVRGGQLDQLDMALAPLAFGLDPVGGAQLVVEVEILVMLEDAVALHQAEAARIAVDEGGDGGLDRVAQRAPDPLAGAGVHQQPVGIVQFAAVVVEEAAVVLAGEEHRGEGGEAKLGDLAPGEEMGRDGHDGGPAGEDEELEGAGDGGAVEQGVDGDAVRPRRWRLHPELAEIGELLAPRHARANGEAARGEPVLLAAAEEAEIARADEGDQLVMHARVVEGEMQAKAREARIHRQGRFEAGAAIVEQVGGVGNGRGDALAHDVHGDGPGEQEAQMEQVHPVGRAWRVEEGPLGAEADVAPLVELQPPQRLGQLHGLGLVGDLGEVAGAAHHVLEGESRRGRGAGRRGGRGLRRGRLLGHEGRRGRRRRESRRQTAENRSTPHHETHSARLPEGQGAHRICPAAACT